MDMNIMAELERYPKAKIVVTAILAGVERQAVTLHEFEMACELVKRMVRCNLKVKSLVEAIIHEAAEQEIPPKGVARACDLAKELISNEIAVSSMGVSEFAKRAQAAIHSEK